MVFKVCLRSLKCRAIFVSLWKPIEEKKWSAGLASLMNHFDHHTDILDRSWLICIYLFMSSWLHDVPVWLLHIPVFAHFKVTPCVSPWLMFFLINPLISWFCSHVYAAGNRDGCSILICWPGCIDVACQYLLRALISPLFFLLDMPSVYRTMMPWSQGSFRRWFWENQMGLLAPCWRPHVRPPSNTPKQYHILVTRGWMMNENTGYTQRFWL